MVLMQPDLTVADLINRMTSHITLLGSRIILAIGLDEYERGIRDIQQWVANFKTAVTMLLKRSNIKSIILCEVTPLWDNRGDAAWEQLAEMNRCMWRLRSKLTQTVHIFRTFNIFAASKFVNRNIERWPAKLKARDFQIDHIMFKKTDAQGPNFKAWSAKAAETVMRGLRGLIEYQKDPTRFRNLQTKPRPTADVISMMQIGWKPNPAGKI